MVLLWRRGSASVALMLLSVVVAWAAGVIRAQTPAGTEFSYQGRLVDGALAANGPYDLQFSLFDAATAGGQIGSSLERGSVAVAKGLFTVELDFGGAAFNGDARWLEIGVRPGGTADPYTILAPRQKLNPTPYAMRATDSPGGAGGGASGGLAPVIGNYPVAAGNTIAPGEVVSVLNGEARQGFPHNPSDSTKLFHGNDSNSNSFGIASLSQSRFVLAYVDDSTGVLPQIGKARVGTVTDGMPSLGPEFTFNARGTEYVSIAAVSSNTIVVAYRDNNSSGRGTATVGIVSGDTITFGSEFLFNLEATDHVDIEAMSPSKVAILYNNEALSLCSLIIGEVAGSLIAFGLPQPVAGYGLSDRSLAGLSDSLVIIAYSSSEPGLNYQPHIRAAAVSTNVITMSPYTLFDDVYLVNHVDVATLDASRFVVSYRTQFGVAGYAVVGSYSAPDFAFGPRKLFQEGAAFDQKITGLSSSSVAIAYTNYADGGGSPPAQTMTGSVSGMEIAFGATQALGSLTGYKVDLTNLSATQYAVAYIGLTPLVTAEYVSIVGAAGRGLIGLARSGGSSGEVISVQARVPSSVCDALSGLLGGNYYYGLPGGPLTLSPTTTPIGRAIAPNKLLFTEP